MFQKEKLNKKEKQEKIKQSQDFKKSKMNIRKQEFNAQKYVKDNLSLEQVLDYKNMFDTFDNDGSGTLNLEELNKILKKLDVESSTPHLKEKLEELQQQEKGELKFDCFLMLIKAYDQDNQENEEKLKQQFKKISSDGEFISLDDFRLANSKINSVYTEEELNKMLFHADIDTDFKISFAEFKIIMQRKYH